METLNGMKFYNKINLAYDIGNKLPSDGRQYDHQLVLPVIFFFFLLFENSRMLLQIINDSNEATRSVLHMTSTKMPLTSGRQRISRTGLNRQSPCSARVTKV